MDRKEEENYRRLLENMVREEKESGFFFKKDSDSYYLDIELLFRHVLKKDPKVLDKLFDRYLDASKIDGLEDASTVQKLCANLKKGTIVRWVDKDGHELFYVNSGRSPLTGKKQLSVVTNILGSKDLKYLKGTFMEKVLKRDIKAAYEKVSRENNIQKKKKASRPSLFREVVASRNGYHRHELRETGNSFEKKFKNIVRAGGTTSVDPRLVARMVYEGMSGCERRDLAAAFATTTESGFNALLLKWKDEALSPGKERVFPHIARRKDKDMGVGR